MLNEQKVRPQRVVVIGVGNVLRGDDGLGPALVRLLRPSKDCVLIDAGTAPENYLGKVSKENPDTILIIDAVSLNKKPGEYEILEGKDIISSGFGTHDISPKVFMDFLSSQTNARIYMIGIQPKHTSFGAEMSQEVKEAIEKIARHIQEKLDA